MSDTQNLPTPPLPATVDLRDFPYMPLDVARLRDSETAVRTTGDEFRCAVILWCAAWHQVPAASLPDDDVVLADLAGFGRVVKEWKRLRDGALRGFVKCSDGRLYHQVVVEKALTAWLAKLAQRHRTECARLKKQAQRTGRRTESPTFDLWISRERPEAMPYLSKMKSSNVPEDMEHSSQGQLPAVRGEIASKRSKGIFIPSLNNVRTGDSEPRANCNEPLEKDPTSIPEASSTFIPSGGLPEHAMRQLPKHIREGIEAKRAAWKS